MFIHKSDNIMTNLSDIIEIFIMGMNNYSIVVGKLLHRGQPANPCDSCADLQLPWDMEGMYGRIHLDRYSGGNKRAACNRYDRHVYRITIIGEVRTDLRPTLAHLKCNVKAAEGL